jgi:leucyl-tRNA synthetase
VLDPFVLLLAPYAPHAAEELWRVLGHDKTLAYEPWPQYDPALTKADTIEVPVQVNGKIKAKLMVPAETDAKELEAIAMADESVKAALAEKSVKKVIVVPKKLVNVVVG